MDRKQLIADIAAVLTTLREVNEPSPRSSIYMALGMDMKRYETLEQALVGAGFVKTTSQTITLTGKGIESADNIIAALANAKAASDSPLPAKDRPYREDQAGI